MSDNPVQLNLDRASLAEYAGGVQPARNVPSDNNELKTTGQTADKAVHAAPEPSEKSGSSMKLVRDEQSGRSFVQILDRKTGDVIYQIPPEELLKLSAILKEINGRVVNERV